MVVLLFKIKTSPQKRLWLSHPATTTTSKWIISTLLAVNWKGADLYFCLWTFFVYTPCAAARIFLHWCDAWNTFDYILIGLIKQLMHIFPTFNFLFSFLEADFVSNQMRAGVGHMLYERRYKSIPYFVTTQLLSLLM